MKVVSHISLSDTDDAPVARIDALPILTGQTKHQSWRPWSSPHQAKDSLLGPGRFLSQHMFTLEERAQLQGQIDVNVNLGTALLDVCL